MLLQTFLLHDLAQTVLLLWFLNVERDEGTASFQVFHKLCGNEGHGGFCCAWCWCGEGLVTETPCSSQWFVREYQLHFKLQF